MIQRVCVLVTIVEVLLSTSAIGQDQAKKVSEFTSANPFFSEYATPFQTPPFDLIKNEHFMPAFRKGMEEQSREIAAIVANPAPPTFQNTIEVLDQTGGMLTKVNSVFLALQAANATDEIQNIAQEVTPLLTNHRDNINLNAELFKRVHAVYLQRKQAGLTTEQLKLVEDVHAGFVRGGANLPPEKKIRFRSLNEELSMLTLAYSENILKETDAFTLVIERPEDLAGLPQSAIDGAADAAAKASQKGKWTFTPKKPSLIPFLQYAKNRELRQKLFTAYIMRGNNKNANDNTSIASRIAAIRVELANLLGYQTFADFSLETNMAKTPKTVYDFLNRLWEPALKNAKKEREEMQALIKEEGGAFTLQPWDWWYYAEKIRKRKYDLDESELRPYFLMANVQKGAFDLATKLYGIQFIERKDIPTYSDEVSVFEVKEGDGKHIGLLYTDYYPRPGKRAGAWCDIFRRREKRGDRTITPLVYNVGNFSRPTGDKPALLSTDNVRTLFHEFGHALHCLFEKGAYKGLSIPGDFVELPSQIMENWAFEPDMLRLYARHYQTGEPIPQSLIDKIVKSRMFNQGFNTVEYLAACFLDMDWHMLANTTLVEADEFEKQSMAKIRLIPEIEPRYRSTYFEHIFGSWNYSAGYYYYIWAAVLDADAFEAFKEKGLFDQTTARAFREFVLARGTADDAMVQYEKFRGKKPSIEPLLKRRGLM